MTPTTNHSTKYSSTPTSSTLDPRTPRQHHWSPPRPRRSHCFAALVNAFALSISESTSLLSSTTQQWHQPKDSAAAGLATAAAATPIYGFDEGPALIMATTAMADAASMAVAEGKLEFSPALQFAPDAYHFSELSAEDAVLARTFRREHVHGASLADKARDSRRFNNAAQALELAFAALDQPIRHGRNEPACFTCTDPSGHVVAASREPERGYADNAARWCCPLCLEPIFQPDDCDDDVEEDGGDGGVGGRDVFFDSDTDGDDGDGNGWW
eukprot:gene8815-1892_t